MASELLWEKVHTQIFIIIIYTTSVSSRTWKLEEEEEKSIFLRSEQIWNETLS